MAGRGAKPGERRGGRKKGTPNKTTSSVKAAILDALNDGDGAVEFFKKLKKDDIKTFANLCGRLPGFNKYHYYSEISYVGIRNGLQTLPTGKGKLP